MVRTGSHGTIEKVSSLQMKNQLHDRKQQIERAGIFSDRVLCVLFGLPEIPVINEPVECYHCGSKNVVRNGQTNNGKQRYKCRGCGCNSREDAQGPGYSEAEKELILRTYNERPSMRGITRIFGVSRPTLIKWLKKRP
jgi:transposase-like protein